MPARLRSCSSAARRASKDPRATSRTSPPRPLAESEERVPFPRRNTVASGPCPAASMAGIEARPRGPAPLPVATEAAAGTWTIDCRTKATEYASPLARVCPALRAVCEGTRRSRPRSRSALPSRHGRDPCAFVAEPAASATALSPAASFLPEGGPWRRATARVGSRCSPDRADSPPAQASAPSSAVAARASAVAPEVRVGLGEIAPGREIAERVAQSGAEFEGAIVDRQRGLDITARRYADGQGVQER